MAAYKKKFNPDALPAQVTPEEAAQALGQLEINQRPGHFNQASTTSPAPTQTPATIRQQRPSNIQPHGDPYYRTSSAPHVQSTEHFTSSPTGTYGSGPGQRPFQPPPQQHTSLAPQRRPLPQYDYPSRTPAPPDPESGQLWQDFQAANVSHTGALTSQELGSALVNADFTPFDPATIRSLMKMFSHTPPGQVSAVNYPAFQNLCRYLADWRQIFERFDQDASGRISLGEFSNALVAFGYRLSTSFVSTLYNAFGGSKPQRRNGADGHMTFDLFVQACMSLRRMTDVFKGYDDDRDGYVILSFEEFLTEILRSKDQD